MLIVSLIRKVKPTPEEDKAMVIAMCNLWFDAIIEPDEEVINVMKQYGVTIDHLHSMILKWGIPDKNLWKHQDKNLE